MFQKCFVSVSFRCSDSFKPALPITRGRRACRRIHGRGLCLWWTTWRVHFNSKNVQIRHWSESRTRTRSIKGCFLDKVRIYLRWLSGTTASFSFRHSITARESFCGGVPRVTFALINAATMGVWPVTFFTGDLFRKFGASLITTSNICLCMTCFGR